MKKIITALMAVLMTGCIVFPSFASPVDDDDDASSTVIVIDDEDYVITKKNPYAPTNQYGPGATPGGWYQDDTTKRYYFVYLDGHRVYDKWEEISGKWYLFDKSGFIIQNQWVEYKGKWYCLGLDGAMYTSCMTPDGYFVDENGAWIEHIGNQNKGPGSK